MNLVLMLPASPFGYTFFRWISLTSPGSLTQLDNWPSALLCDLNSLVPCMTRACSFLKIFGWRCWWIACNFLIFRFICFPFYFKLLCCVIFISSQSRGCNLLGHCNCEWVLCCVIHGMIISWSFICWLQCWSSGTGPIRDNSDKIWK